jgi:hypothetical protein
VGTAGSDHHRRDGAVAGKRAGQAGAAELTADPPRAPRGSSAGPDSLAVGGRCTRPGLPSVREVPRTPAF